MDLLALSDFNLVAHHGGFGRASRAARRPKATLSRRVADLEAALGVRLLERGARVLRLTEEGRTLHERTGALLGEIDEIGETISSGTSHPRGVLRINAPLLFGQSAMGKLAALFSARYPDVRLEVTVEDRPVDMIEEGYDLIIRVNPRRDQDLVGRCFLRDRQVVVAAPTFERPVDNAGVRACLFTAANPLTPWRVDHDGRIISWLPIPVMRLSSMKMVHDAVLAGAGAGLLPLSMVGDDVTAGRLRHWGDSAGAPAELWALYPSRRLLSAKVQAFLEILAEGFPIGTSGELAAFMRDL